MFRRFFPVLLMAILVGCFDPQEGCLDIAAVNYYPAADEDCCCRYPKLIINADQTYDTQLFKQDSLYPTADGHLFRIKSIAFYLSEFQLFKNGNVFLMGDSLEFKTYDAAQNDTISRLFTDDFTLIRRVPFANQVASFREDGAFDQIRFRLGLNESAETIIPSLTASSHPLYPQKENLYQQGFVFFQAVVVRDSAALTAPDTLNFFRQDLPDLFITGQGDFIHQIGTDFTLTLHADWSRLFDGVNWTVHDIPAWKSKIVANMPSVFSVTP
ncbi:MAG: hypothetical protein JNJ57_09620 [Saprospiraceae bacterium]|nr:hypothetical protein [Saprospiraceae bacterium]